MKKPTKATLIKYNNINKAGGVNGFKIDMHKLIYPFAYGDEYPQLNYILLNDENTQLIIKASYFKYYGGEGEYILEGIEYEKNKETSFVTNNSSKHFKKVFQKIESNRFCYTTLKKIVKNLNIEELKKDVLNSYSDFLLGIKK